MPACPVLRVTLVCAPRRISVVASSDAGGSRVGRLALRRGGLAARGGSHGGIGGTSSTSPLTAGACCCFSLQREVDRM